MRWIRLIVELFGYAGLAFVATGIAAMVYASSGGRCPQFSTGGIKCVTPFAQSIAEYGFTVALLTVFTGIPLLLAFTGIGFIIWRIIRRSDERKKAARAATRAMDARPR